MDQTRPKFDYEEGKVKYLMTKLTSEEKEQIKYEGGRQLCNVFFFRIIPESIAVGILNIPVWRNKLEPTFAKLFEKNVHVEQTHYTHESTVVSEAKFVIEIRRKPLHYVVSLVVPSYIIAILSVAGLYARFSTKPERQERFTLGVTSILTMAVLSLIVSEKVPHSAKHVPFLIQYFLYNIVVITIATALTWPILSLGRRGSLLEAKFPPKLLLLVFFVKTEKFRIYLDDDTPFELNRKVIAETWEKLASHIDMLCMIVFLLFVSVPTFFIFIQCAQLIQVHDVGVVSG
uniref:Neurotransmitter-gated ion-channel transmembrane domain-containing protein n=1 Tax=Acrobeloides nanus TaxID=290746 RepID=A0A914DKU5_9BILA